ncbi:MAG TPA: hypothetical protein VG125_23880, partial [Pirellulales bacterium]|nr:hypothetical protein [Pirellulales bacterium]
LDLYHRDEAAMQAAGCTDYSQFVKAIFSAIQKHADREGWLPVYWNIGDEPLGDELTRSAENAEAYRGAFPQGPPLFTIPSSFAGNNAADPHFRLAKAVHVVAWNLHDAASVDLLHKSGSDWAFYNGGDRWTYGTYMYKAARQYGMKYRLSWHWNAVAGDPYYPLDCREDDYAWCNSGPNGELVPAVQFERLREGLDDYRRFMTLERLAGEKASTPAGKRGSQIIADLIGTFQLGDREPRSAKSYADVRARLDAAIESLR